MRRCAALCGAVRSRVAAVPKPGPGPPGPPRAPGQTPPSSSAPQKTSRRGSFLFHDLMPSTALHVQGFCLSAGLHARRHLEPPSEDLGRSLGAVVVTADGHAVMQLLEHHSCTCCPERIAVRGASQALQGWPTGACQVCRVPQPHVPPRQSPTQSR